MSPLFEMAGLYRDIIAKMKARVQHYDSCQTPDCSCDDDPPSLAEVEWVTEIAQLEAKK